MFRMSTLASYLAFSWTKSQVRARSHPNVLAATAWMNNMYHTKSDTKIKDVDLSAPLSYADRFRMRSPGTQWVVHPPHVDGQFSLLCPACVITDDANSNLGGAIERWEDETYRKCFTDILNGNWRKHDPYDAMSRIDARKSMEGKENQVYGFDSADPSAMAVDISFFIGYSISNLSRLALVEVEIAFILLQPSD